MNRLNKYWLILLLVFAMFYLQSCHEEPTVAPKPQGYFRIDLPQHAYQQLDTNLLPFTFQYSSSAICSFEDKNGAIWIHVHYPAQRATFEMTYLPIKNQNFRELMLIDEDFVKLHQVKADNIENSFVQDDSSRLFGKIYDIEGKEVACPIQFWLSDTTHHYLRSSLYFDFTPNNDSLQPVIQYLREDMMQMINTFEWK
ncbi:MAG TPA: hypothetical protein PK740_07870 [Bacteroidales bacterium]|nr:hypothetical protein [Bacteroidales bacterium]